jgi:hypothetical protein
MKRKEIFLSEQNQVSRRWGILEDDGKSAWLYITEREEESIVADAFVYNRVDPIQKSKIREHRGGPPPICETYASTEAQMGNPVRGQFSLFWSRDGESVAVLSHSNPIAMIINTKKFGYSKAVAVDGPWGHPWDQDLYDRIFAEQAGRGERE